MTNILITGGTGSLGQELVRQLLAFNKVPNVIQEIKIFSRNESLQIKMQREFNDTRLKFCLGDVRDYSSLLLAMKGVDHIIHCASLKHIQICEQQPQEAIKTNILGITNVINAAIESKVSKFLNISTDKSIVPSCLYGATKLIAEKITLNANHLTNETKFSCIRAGNMLGSSNSIVPFFIDQIKRFNKIPITHPFMTRFFLTIKEVSQLIFTAFGNSIGGEIFVMKMPVCKIIDIAEVLKKHYGNSETKTEIIGIRPGEKIRETLISEYEAPNTFELDDNYYIILPEIKTQKLKEHYEKINLKSFNMKAYSSNYKLMTLEEVETMLKNSGFLNSPML